MKFDQKQKHATHTRMSFLLNRRTRISPRTYSDLLKHMSADLFFAVIAGNATFLHRLCSCLYRDTEGKTPQECTCKANYQTRHAKMGLGVGVGVMMGQAKWLRISLLSVIWSGLPLSLDPTPSLQPCSPRAKWGAGSGECTISS